MKYRKKPVVIEAFRLEFRLPAPLWIQTHRLRMNLEERYCDIETLEGTMRAREGDWIIQGVEGELYPCKDSIFRATYEAVEEETQ